MLKAGDISEFRQIFTHIPKSTVYTDLGMNYDRFKGMLLDTSLFQLHDLIAFAKLLDMESREIIELALKQYEQDREKKKKK